MKDSCQHWFRVSFNTKEVTAALNIIIVTTRYSTPGLFVSDHHYNFSNIKRVSKKNLALYI